MNQLTVEGFLFIMFWGAAIMFVGGIILWAWEAVADCLARKRFWRSMRERNRDWIERDWND